MLASAVMDLRVAGWLPAVMDQQVAGLATAVGLATAAGWLRSYVWLRPQVERPSAQNVKKC